MALRTKLQNTATRLINKYGDTVQTVTITVTDGVDEFDPPTLTPIPTDINAVVTGVSKWETIETILSSDLKCLVSGVYPVADIGGSMTIGGKQYKIIERQDILATGVKSAVKYFVRRG